MKASIGWWVVALLIVIGAGAWYWSDTRTPAAPSASAGGAVACTAEALLCPDGSGVGRSGAECQFAPCPDQDSFTGKLEQDTAGFRLVMDGSPVPGDTTYTMPLEIDPSEEINALIGSKITVHGFFEQGNELMVINFSKAAAAATTTASAATTTASTQ